MFTLSIDLPEADDLSPDAIFELTEEEWRASFGDGEGGCYDEEAAGEIPF